MRSILTLILIPILSLAGKNHATVINEVKINSAAKVGTALATINAEVAFTVPQGSFHPHNSELNITEILLQAKQFGDGSWQLFKAGESCLGLVKIGQQLRIKGEIGKKIHIYCERTNVQN